jgi:hypothetical protein
MDNELSFTTRVDLSGLNAGASEAQVILEKLLETTVGAMEQEAAAFNAVSEAFAEFDAFLEQGVADSNAYAASISEIAASYGAKAQAEQESINLMQQEAEAFNAVSSAFAEFDSLLAAGISENEAYAASLTQISTGYEAQVAAQQAAATAAADAAASQAIAEIMLQALSQQRTDQEIKSAAFMRGIYAERASATAFAVESNASYAASVAQVTAAYQSLTGVQSEQVAVQEASASTGVASLEAATAAETDFATTVEAANAQLEAQGVLWLQNAQAAEAVAAPVAVITEANAAVGASAVASADEGVAAYATLEQATQAVADATMLLASVQEQFGRQAALGNEWAISTIKQYEVELAQANEAVQILSASQAEETAVLSENTVAVAANTAANYSRAEALGAARVGAAATTGSLGGMEMGLARVAAASSTLGPILQAIFPFAAIAAGVFIVYQLGEAFEKAYEKASQAGQEMARAFDEANDKIDLQNSELDVQNDKLQQQIDKLEGNHNNGLKTALDEAIVSADKLQKMLAGDTAELAKLLKEHDVTAFQGAVFSVGSTTAVGKELTEASKKKELDEANLRDSHTDKLTDIASRAPAAKTKDEKDAIRAEETKAQDEYYKGLQKIQQHYIDFVKSKNDEQLKLQRENNNAVRLAAQGFVERGNAPADTDYSPGVALTGGELSNAQRRMKTLKAEQLQGSLDAELDPLKAAKGPKGPKGLDPAQARLKEIEEQFSELQAATASIHARPLNPEEALAFWSPFLAEFESGSQHYKKLVDQASDYEPGSAMSKKLLIEAGKLSGANSAYKKVLDEVNKGNEAKHKDTFKELLTYDPSAAKQFASGAAEYQVALKAIAKDTDEDLRAQSEIGKSQIEIRKEFAKTNDTLTHTGEAWVAYTREVAKGQEIQADNAAKFRAANTAIDEADGRITHLAAVERKAKQDAEDWTEKIKLLRDELKALQAQAQIKIDPITGQSVNTDPKNAQQQQQVQNKIAQAEGGQAVSGANNNQAQAQALAAPYLKAFDQINQGWLKVQSDLIMGNKNIARDFVQMGANLVQAGAQAAEKWLAKQISTYILDVARHHIATTTKTVATTAATTAETTAQTTALAAQTAAVTTAVAAQTAAVATGAAAQTAAIITATTAAQTVTATADVAEASSYAAVAAAGTLAYYSGFAPEIAPEMAAAQYGIGMAFAGMAAFDTGGVIPGSGAVPIIGHGGERVLTPGQTNTFENFVSNMTNNSQGGNSTVNASVQQNFHGAKASSARETQASIKNLMRRGKLA